MEDINNYDGIIIKDVGSFGNALEICQKNSIDDQEICLGKIICNGQKS